MEKTSMVIAIEKSNEYDMPDLEIGEKCKILREIGLPSSKPWVELHGSISAVCTEIRHNFSKLHRHLNFWKMYVKYNTLKHFT